MPKRVKREVLGKRIGPILSVARAADLCVHMCQGCTQDRTVRRIAWKHPHRLPFFCFVANKWLTRSANGTVRRASFDFPSRTCIHPYRALPAGLDARHSIATPGPRPSAKRNPAIPRPRHGVTEGKLLDKPAQSCGRGRNRETSLLAADEPLACP